MDYTLYHGCARSSATWNALPDHIHTVADPVKFRKLLKSNYFSQAFNICSFLCLNIWLSSIMHLYGLGPLCNSSVLFFSRPRSDGWPHHGRTFSIFLCPLSFWLTLAREVLSMFWCCPSRPCVAFLACVHLTLFLALSLSPANSLVSSWCDHSMLAYEIWRRWQK